MVHTAPLGDAVQFCSVFNFQIVFRGLFSVNPALPKNAAWFGASIGNAHYKGEKYHGPKCRALLIHGDIAYWFCFPGAETEMDKIKDDSKIKRETSLDRHGLRPIPNVCHIPVPPWFSLQTTFNGFYLTKYGPLVHHNTM
jgi:hypothetical protein